MGNVLTVRRGTAGRSEERGLPWGPQSPQAPGSVFAAEDGCVNEGCQEVCVQPNMQ